jgi:hypothetical protein
VSNPVQYEDWNKEISASLGPAPAGALSMASPVSRAVPSPSPTSDSHNGSNSKSHLNVDLLGASTYSEIGSASNNLERPLQGQIIDLRINLCPGCCGGKVSSRERVMVVDYDSKAISWKKSVDCCLYTDRWQVVVPIECVPDTSITSATAVENSGHGQTRYRCLYVTALSVPGATGFITRIAFAARILRCFKEFAASLREICES